MAKNSPDEGKNIKMVEKQAVEASMINLKEYRAKRQFGKTPEPMADTVETPNRMPVFVVQKHDASHFHFDFRLEVDGVLKSWVVPKGPSMNPKDKRLAIEVEDHPLSYAHFEGVIPEGNYGAGTVEIWDSGTYAYVGNNRNISAAIKNGILEFKLHGHKLAGTRIIPLVIKKEKMETAQAVCSDGPILTLKPFHKKKFAVLTTGNEVYYHRIEDTFTPVIQEKLAEFGAEMIFHEVYDDDASKITDGCRRAMEAGADLVFCTGGMSVDPDDKTPLAIKNTGARIVSYGAPVLPGAMFLLAYAENGTPIVGLPGCVMYSKRTIFDLVLPRLIADDEVIAEELAGLGEGGLCLNCKVCTFPNCGFGK